MRGAIVTELHMLESESFTLLNGTADAAFGVDEQGLICSWNRAAEQLFGYLSSAHVLAWMWGQSSGGGWRGGEKQRLSYQSQQAQQAMSEGKKGKIRSKSAFARR